MSGRNDGGHDSLHSEASGAGRVNLAKQALRQRVETALRSSPHVPWQRPLHAFNNGTSTGISTVAPSIRACAIANGTNLRSRRYKSVSKTENGTDPNSRNAMNLASKVNGMKACCMDQANATTAMATLVLRKRTWKRDTR